MSGASSSSPRDDEEDEVKVFNHEDEDEEKMDNKEEMEVNELKKGLIDENEKRGASSSTSSATSSSHSHPHSSTTSGSSHSSSASSATPKSSSLSSSSSFTPFPSLGYPFPPFHHPNGSLESMMMRSYPQTLFPDPSLHWRSASMSPTIPYPMTHSHPSSVASAASQLFAASAAAAFYRTTGQSWIKPYPPPPLAHTGYPSHELATASLRDPNMKSHHDHFMAALHGHHPLLSHSPLSHNSPLSYPSPLSSSHPTPPPHPSLLGTFSSSSMVSSPSTLTDTKPNVHTTSLSHAVDSMLNGSHSSSSSSTSSSSVNRSDRPSPATSSSSSSVTASSSSLHHHQDHKSKSLVNGSHHVNHNNNRLNAVNQNHPNKNSLHLQHSQNNSSSNNSSNNNCSNNNCKDMSHVKKPLNAFMLFMREQRSKVVAEHMLKESAAINQILGKMWHGLSREDQQKYYDMARKAKSLHHQMYPGWTARDNYAINQKKKKKKRDKSVDGDSGSSKKCRARYGLDNQASWCKPCRRKKKCILFQESEGNIFNLGSVGSTDAKTPDSKNESDVEKSIQDGVVGDHHHHHRHNNAKDSLPPGLSSCSLPLAPFHPFYRSPV